MKAIGLCGSECENQAIVAAQLLSRFTHGGLAISVCIGITSVEDANLLHVGGGEMWRVGAGAINPALVGHIDRDIDTDGAITELIDRVDQAIGLFLGKTRVGS